MIKERPVDDQPDLLHIAGDPISMQALPFPYVESPRTSVKLKLFTPQSRENKTVNTSWVHCLCRRLFGEDITHAPQDNKPVSPR